jgi:hypothetical protein
VTPGVSARAGAPTIVRPIAAANMVFLNIDTSLVQRRVASLINR